jgi:hypothetical protein
MAAKIREHGNCMNADCLHCPWVHLLASDQARQEDAIRIHSGCEGVTRL